MPIAKKKATAGNKQPSPRKKAPSRGGPRKNAGGARPGGGRKKGSATKRTRQIADALAESSDISPLEYMLATLNTTDEHLKAEHKAGKITSEEYIVKLRFNLERRDQAAKDAAPYIHPRLSSITAEVKGTEHDRWVALQAEAGII